MLPYDGYIDLPNGYLLMSDVIVDNASIQKKINSDDMAQAAGPGYDLIRYLKESGFTVCFIMFLREYSLIHL